jgi:hypothetical protein
MRCPFPLSTLVLFTFFLPSCASAYEDYALEEGMSCNVCHKDTRTFLLTPRGREYKHNGYSFKVKVAPLVTPKPGSKKTRLRGPRTPVTSPIKQLMTRSNQVLQETSRTVAQGYYERAARAAGELQELAGKIEGSYRSDRSATADLARLLRNAAFRLERTLRTEGDRRPDLAPLHLGRVVGACLRCHLLEGISQEEWSRDQDPSGHAPRLHRHRPDARTPRPEGPLPSRSRSWNEIRR